MTSDVCVSVPEGSNAIMDGCLIYALLSHSQVAHMHLSLRKDKAKPKTDHENQRYDTLTLFFLSVAQDVSLSCLVYRAICCMPTGDP